MPFPNSQPNLSNTIFNDNDLHLARKVLQTIISQVNSAWLKRPLGILGEYWLRDDTYAACFLIDFARMIDILKTRVADKSIPRLYEKVKELLQPLSREQFIEKMTELQVAFALAELIDSSPLAFLKSEDIIQPKVSRCPDFAFQMPEGVISAEASVFHGGILDAWTQSASYIKKAIQDELFKRNRMLNVHIALPLEAEMDTKQIVDLALKEMDTTAEKGRVLIGKKGTIEWEPFPIITVQDLSSSSLDVASSVVAYRSPGVIIDRAFASQTQIVFPSEEDVQQAKELVLKSLRQKLREKRGQFFTNGPEPGLLVMKLEHDQLGEGDIADMLQNRIWPNEKEYDWLSGMVLFTARSGFSLSDSNVHLTLYLNPKTLRPVYNSLREIFKGTT